MKYRVYKAPRFDRPWRVRHPDGHVFGFPTFEDALVGMRWHQARFYPAMEPAVDLIHEIELGQTPIGGNAMTYATDLALVRAVLLPEFLDYVGGEPGNGEVMEYEARESADRAADAVLAALDEAHLAEGISADLKGLVETFAKTKGSYQLGVELAEHLGLGDPGSQYPDPVLSPQMKALDDTLPCLRHDPVVVHGQMVCRRCHQVRNRATQKWPHPQGPPSSLDSGDGCTDERPPQHHW